MEQPLAAGKTATHFNGMSELTAVKNPVTATSGNIYMQILQALPGSLSANSLVTPLNELPLDNPVNRLLKRIADVLISLLVIVGLLSWFIPLMAILIKLDSKGPVFFLQRRNKRNGAVFTCIKFRSMLVNAEADVLPAAKNDRRITRVGRFIRANFIDELPQFFNVLMGDMSVVGPRPHMLSDNLRYQDEIEYYDYRHRVKPGITGLAQVMGYIGVADEMRKMRERVNMDNFYLRHWTIRMDILILFRTILKAFGR